MRSCSEAQVLSFPGGEARIANQEAFAPVQLRLRQCATTASPVASARYKPPGSLLRKRGCCPRARQGGAAYCRMTAKSSTARDWRWRFLEMSRVAKDRTVFGPMLETFVFSEVLKQASWLGESCALYHYRDKDQDEVDLVIETGSGVLVGIEVKASATVNAGDFKELRKLAEDCGDNFKLGVVLYDGGRPVPLGDRLVAAPMSCLWA
jgi:hypothetical protein